MRSKPLRGSISKKGYRRIRCNGRLKFEHVIVWEQHHGPIPLGMEIHHINGDKLDNRIENLMLVTRLEHKRIHSDCYRFGERWFKRCKRCRWFHEIGVDIYFYPGGRGASIFCKRCAVDIAVANKKRRRELARLKMRVTENTPALAGVGSKGGN